MWSTSSWRDRCRRIGDDAGPGTFIHAIPTALFDSSPKGLERTLSISCGCSLACSWQYHHPVLTRDAPFQRNHVRSSKRFAGQSIPAWRTHCPIGAAQGLSTPNRLPRDSPRLTWGKVEPAHRDPGQRVDQPINKPARADGSSPQAGWYCKKTSVFTKSAVSNRIRQGQLMWFMQKALRQNQVCSTNWVSRATMWPPEPRNLLSTTNTANARPSAGAYQKKKIADQTTFPKQRNPPAEPHAWLGAKPAPSPTSCILNFEGWYDAIARVSSAAP